MLSFCRQNLIFTLKITLQYHQIKRFNIKTFTVYKLIIFLAMMSILKEKNKENVYWQTAQKVRLYVV